ncbi:MAG: MerR family transcriptional regulator [Burkholderiales bacterium]
MTSEVGVYRIGAVSRRAGLPVSTLRVWERRYAAFAPDKSEGKHRLYSEADLVRARLLRQLTEAGHRIGGIATLPAQQLQSMLSAERELAEPLSATPAMAKSVAAVVIGAALAVRLDAPGWRQHSRARGLRVESVFADLEEMQAAGPGSQPPKPASLLVARLNTVQPGVAESLASACTAFGIQKAIVLYNFGAEATLGRLRSTGVILRREPVPDAELAQLIDSVLLVDSERMAESGNSGVLIPARRYSDESLARVAAATGGLLCECPKHLADLITQLASFEAYSEECLNATSRDAEIHGYLRSISGSARALFEHALDLVTRHAGLEAERA